ncbi:primase-helicase family protein [Mesorhizobium huakuii]|uniref:NrS-1 polymerase-like helicase domain-containing protein n=1 Tax=Mesorhizobium huakuii TaxID=28104 RepID=A0A7G6SMC9_9HYPH|nr:primase-helicase family protein [Mesorhizobium huakuii]QND55661.1 hypothetical protein HB778_02465 [Mesorhizobium huakuii]
MTVDEFVAYLPTQAFIHLPTMEPWIVAARIDAQVPPIAVDDGEGGTQNQSASKWMERHRGVQSITWMPGEPELIKDVMITADGPIRKKGSMTLNRYRAPTIAYEQGDVTPWLDLLDRAYPDDANHILACLAHRVQRPGDKINHALVLGGEQGIGKDTILEPVVSAIGVGNFAEIAPDELMSPWTHFARSVILRINEVHDLGETNRFTFYDRSKRYCVAPPSTLKVNEKHLRQYYVQNVCFPIMTTNHMTDGMYLPANDRRHYVAWSKLKTVDIPAGYFKRLYSWYENGGDAIVADYLANLDLDAMGFDPKAAPVKTEAFWAIVGASAVPEDAEMADALTAVENPAAVTLSMLSKAAHDARNYEFGRWLQDRGNSRRVPHRLESCGYTATRNHGATNGLWTVNGKKQVIYTRSELTPQQRQKAAENLANTGA